MRKYSFVLGTCLLLWSHQSIAQSVAINNDASLPTLGSMLDIKSSNKGLLIPRVALTGPDDILTVPVRPEGLLVYNTASSAGGSVVPGFYYWDGASWVRLTNNTNALLGGWLLGGNNGTSPATHFLGTRDNNALVFKVNSQRAGYIGNATNDGNVFWGYLSGNSNSGYSNVGIGIGSLYNNTTSSNLVAVGDSTLYNNIGSGNVAIGSEALYSNTSGELNTAVGTNAMRLNVGGSSNVALGYNSFRRNVSGFGNVAIGTISLPENVTGNFNTANGYLSLGSNTSGDYNTAIGSVALNSNTTGSQNSAIGSTAMNINSTGSQNSAMGIGSMYNNSTGNRNTANGSSSLYNNTSGTDNCAFGFSSLSVNTTGHHNTAIGEIADVLTPSLSNATAIGANSRVDCSNCLVLGSVTGINGGVKDVNVGIGETNPRYRLSFGGGTGDKISLFSGASSYYGFGVVGGALQIHTDISTSDIVFGYGNSSAMNETMRIKGNGDLEAQKLTVGNGTLLSKEQTGTATVGSNGSNFKTFTVTFPTAFSGIPKITANAKNDPAFGGVNDTFVVTIRSVSATSVTFNILRVDTNAAWLQNLLLDWMAWE